MKNIRLLILGSVALAAVLSLAPQVVHAAPADSSQLSSLSALSFEHAPLPLLAQADSPIAPATADTKAAVTTPATPWYLTTEFFAAMFSLAAGIVAVVKDTGKKKAEKINSILVLGIEAATKIPKVAEFEKKIKGDIKLHASRLGVQPVLDRLVKDLTK